MSKIRIQVDGLKKLIALADADLVNQEMKVAFERSTKIVNRDAKKMAPVDKGHLRSSIAWSVDPAPKPLWGAVGTNLSYAPYQEFGTGVYADGPAQYRKGQSRKGGIKPKRYLRGALELNTEKVYRQFELAIQRVQNKWRN